MENQCNAKMKPKFYFISNTLDLSSKVNLRNKLKTFRLYVNGEEFDLLQLGSKHFIKGKKYKVINILYFQLDVEAKMFDMYITFKKLKQKKGN
jgi:hypothetical protein